MRIMFVENKHMVRTWEAIAPHLMAAGDDVHWLIQNPMWTPKHGSAHRIRWPRKSELVINSNNRFLKTRHRDRGINYFGGNDLHYSFYDNQIRILVEEIKPDVIIGEATLFHELLAINIAKESGTPYLFPTSIRYPTDRIGFHLGDTQEIVCGSGDKVEDHEVTKLIEIYARRGSVPMFYSEFGKTGKLITLRKKLRNISKNLTASVSRIRGERFNTPPILVKLKLDLKQRNLIKQWDNLASEKSKLNGKFNVLFPLQMLPESTLDTWGYDSRDQNNVIEQMVNASDDDTVFLIKTNPVPRYEITQELVNFVREHPRVRPLPSNTTMNEVFWECDLIVTITGSVAIECFLASKPFVTTVRSFATPFAPERTLIAPGEILDVIQRIRAGKWDSGNSDAKAAFLRHQAATGHKAIIADYHHFPAVLHPENLRALSQAYAKLRQAIDDGRLAREIAAAEARADTR